MSYKPSPSFLLVYCAIRHIRYKPSLTLTVSFLCATTRRHFSTGIYEQRMLNQDALTCSSRRCPGQLPCQAVYGISPTGTSVYSICIYNGGVFENTNTYKSAIAVFRVPWHVMCTSGLFIRLLSLSSCLSLNV